MNYFGSINCRQFENAAKRTVSDELHQNNTNPDPDLVFKFEEAEKVIRRLRRENDEQRREVSSIFNFIVRMIGILK